ncbi:MAG TPA: hypothetical protein VH482_29235 [Thermomicrobiales bacterium]|jgi:hypothetical protein
MTAYSTRPVSRRTALAGLGTGGLGLALARTGFALDHLAQDARPGAGRHPDNRATGS